MQLQEPIDSIQMYLQFNIYIYVGIFPVIKIEDINLKILDLNHQVNKKFNFIMINYIKLYFTGHVLLTKINYHCKKMYEK